MIYRQYILSFCSASINQQENTFPEAPKIALLQESSATMNNELNRT